MNNTNATGMKKPFLVMMIVYLLYYSLRMIELMVWRIDQSAAEKHFGTNY